MKPKLIYLFISLISTILVQSQHLPKDTLYGNVKRIRSKVIFLTEKENYQFMYYDDYGHSGFMGPESTINRFYNLWFSTDGCYYLNYERFFDKKGKIVKDNWYGKKDNFMESYRKVYNEKDTLIAEIDSTENSISTRRHYYDYDCENVIFTSPDYDFFSHKFYQYKNSKVIRSKVYDERGVIDEYVYEYNSNGKLKFRIYKNPNSWRKVDETSWGYGPQDSIGHTYKDLVNEYDLSNRLIKTMRFDLYSDPNYQSPILVSETEYKYDGLNLITTIEKESYRHYKYDSANRLSDEFCCDKDISNAKIISKYTYNKDKITHLKYSKADWITDVMKHHKVLFRYKFDEHGNWTEIIKNVNGQDLYKWIREIEYYE